KIEKCLCSLVDNHLLLGRWLCWPIGPDDDAYDCDDADSQQNGCLISHFPLPHVHFPPVDCVPSAIGRTQIRRGIAVSCVHFSRENQLPEPTARDNLCGSLPATT